MSETEHGWVGPILKATAATVVGGIILYELLPGPPAPSSPRIEFMGDPDRAWERVKDTCDVDLLYDFRNQIGSNNPMYDSLARSRINIINQNEPSSPCYQAPAIAPASTTEEPDLPADTSSSDTPCSLLDNTKCLLRLDCEISSDAYCQDAPK